MGTVASEACYCPILSLKMKGFAIVFFFFFFFFFFWGGGGGGGWGGGIEPMIFPGQNTGEELQRGLLAVMAILRFGTVNS